MSSQAGSLECTFLFQGVPGQTGQPGEKGDIGDPGEHGRNVRETHTQKQDPFFLCMTAMCTRSTDNSLYAS